MRYLQKEREEDKKRFNSLDFKFSRMEGFLIRIADKQEDTSRETKSGDVSDIHNNNHNNYNSRDTAFDAVPSRNINVDPEIHVDMETNKNSENKSNKKIIKNKLRIIATSNP